MSKRIIALYDELIIQQSSAPLSQVLPLALRLARELGNDALAQWVRLEIGGYFADNPAVTSDTVLPKYRKVAIQYFDIYGHQLVVDKTWNFINEYGVKIGVEELEALKDNKGPIYFHERDVIEAINSTLRANIHSFAASPISITSILSGIRSRLSDWLYEIQPDIDSLRAAGESPNLDIRSLKECVGDFVRYIESEKRMTFWRSGNARRRIWIHKPEQHAKNLLHTFLTGRFGNSYTFEEITAGAGRIDLFVITPSGENAVIELKMCGHGYSTSYAHSGLEQLTHYMKNKSAKIGYLTIFDSRVKEFSEGFPDSLDDNGMSLKVFIADVRPYVKRKDAPNDV